MFIPYFIPYTLCFDILYESFVLYVHLVILWDMCIYCVDHISSWYIMYNDVMTHSPITVLNPRIQKERKTGRSIWGMGSQWRGLEKKQTGDWDEDKRQAQGERFSAMVDGEWNQRKVQLTWDSQRHLQKTSWRTSSYEQQRCVSTQTFQAGKICGNISSLISALRQRIMMRFWPTFSKWKMRRVMKPATHMPRRKTHKRRRRRRQRESRQSSKRKANSLRHQVPVRPAPSLRTQSRAAAAATRRPRNQKKTRRNLLVC